MCVLEVLVSTTARNAMTLLFELVATGDPLPLVILYGMEFQTPALSPSPIGVFLEMSR